MPALVGRGYWSSHSRSMCYTQDCARSCANCENQQRPTVDMPYKLARRYMLAAVLRTPPPAVSPVQGSKLHLKALRRQFRSGGSAGQALLIDACLLSHHLQCTPGTKFSARVGSSWLMPWFASVVRHPSTQSSCPRGIGSQCRQSAHYARSSHAQDGMPLRNAVSSTMGQTSWQCGSPARPHGW